MGQVTIYLEDEIENKVVEAAKSTQLSKSKWIAKVIKEKVDSQWPLSVQEAAGSWNNFPSAEDLRKNINSKEFERIHGLKLGNWF